jgi:hypothetical protein
MWLKTGKHELQQCAAQSKVFVQYRYAENRFAIADRIPGSPSTTATMTQGIGANVTSNCFAATRKIHAMLRVKQP